MVNSVNRLGTIAWLAPVERPQDVEDYPYALNAMLDQSSLSR